MQCEICGKNAGKGREIELDGSILIVCDACSSFGTVTKEQVLCGEKAPAPMPKPNLRQAAMPYYEFEDLDLGLDLAPDYGSIIRRAREQKGLTVKELAMRVFEKESVLHRVESQSIRPSDSLISKLEKQLGIKLKAKPA
ncbi:MAG: TIGR00270 family protein [Candidatus Diapherotrites archaeon]|uniref:TIGR00270 family protein n=1 Tax=Candidatus Iainarchaeum sp. TaxID=3101447 RepID=A0A938YX59_9ARCH|nr:TIGR00270 family protein [Candidatus Diapherotrites archaeon]